MTQSKHKYRLWTDEQKEMLRTRYTGNLQSALLLAGLTGHPLHSVVGQLHKLGLGRRIEYRVWTPDEEELLAGLITQFPISSVAAKLGRSINSVACKAQQMRLSRRIRDGYFTQGEVAEILGVAHRWVGARIALKELHAEPLNGYIPGNGGSKWHIAESSLRKFIITHATELTGRNVDIAAICSILTMDNYDAK